MDYSFEIGLSIQVEIGWARRMDLIRWPVCMDSVSGRNSGIALLGASGDVLPGTAKIYREIKDIVFSLIIE
jgi:hypothetical protein